MGSSEVPKDLRRSRISRTGSEPGHLRDKVCITVERQCRNPERTPHTQLLLILVHHNFQSHQMFSRKLETNGRRLCQTSIALLTRLSAMLRRVVKILHQRSNQSASK